MVDEERVLRLLAGVVSEGWAPPETNADAIGRLAEHGVLEDPLGVRLRSATGFRNVLVHQYTEVDDARVVAHLDELGDLDAFCTQVADWLGR